MSHPSNLTPPSRVEEDEHDLHLHGGPRPSRAAGVHESIREEGETELKRAASALFWSAIAAAMMGAWMVLPVGTFAGLLASVEASRAHDEASRAHDEATRG